MTHFCHSVSVLNTPWWNLTQYSRWKQAYLCTLSLLAVSSFQNYWFCDVTSNGYLIWFWHMFQASSDSFSFWLIRHSRITMQTLICKRCLSCSSTSTFQHNNGYRSNPSRQNNMASFRTFNGVKSNVRHSSSAITITSAVTEVAASNQDMVTN